MIDRRGFGIGLGALGLGLGIHSQSSAGVAPTVFKMGNTTGVVDPQNSLITAGLSPRLRYYEQEGVSVEYVNMSSITQAMQGMMAGHVDFAGGDHRGDPAVQVRVDPVELVLPRRPVAGDGMDVAVDQAGCDGGAVGIDNGGGALGVDVLRAADCGDFPVLGNDGVGIEDRLLQGAREHQPDVADDQLAGAGRRLCVMGHWGGSLLKLKANLIPA